MKQAKLSFINTLPASLQKSNCVLLYDAVLTKKYSSWIKRFPRRLALQSGEALKDLENFTQLLPQIIELGKGLSREKLTIVSFGGGSVGDFAGFVASVYKRGVCLIHIPSTWLAAMDSAHGGKTALNVGAVKNQIGTFYPAQEIFLVRQVLLEQPSARVSEVAGEYYKTALLGGGKLWRSLPSRTELTAKRLWTDLPDLIAYKYKIVQRDPYEQKNIRAILNLGHTTGHVFEAALQIPHGQAVHLGLLFALRFGEHLGYSKFNWSSECFPEATELQRALQKIGNPLPWLQQDKKLSDAAKIRFIFVRKPGQPIVVEVRLREVCKEWVRQSQ